MNMQRKTWLTLGLLLFAASACLEGAGEGPPSDDGDQVSDNDTADNANDDSDEQDLSDSNCAAQYFLDVQPDASNGSLPAPELTAACETGKVRVATNAIPNHPAGPFPNAGNPNSISAQDDEFTFASDPADSGSVSELEIAFAFGLAINGIVFDPIAAEYYNNDANSGWNYDPLGGGRDLGLDDSFAHVQPDGTYHYHGVPQGLLDVLAADNQVTLIGYASDGFPIYAKWGYSDADDANSAVVELAVSYQLKAGTRPSGPGGEYDGTFVEDYEYVADSGDLDECNGRFGVTPEYPNGIYHYYVTEDFPNIPRCSRGATDSSFAKGPGPGGPP